MCSQPGENHDGIADLCRGAGFFCRGAGFFARRLIGHALADYPLQDEWMNERSDQQLKSPATGKETAALFGTPAS